MFLSWLAATVMRMSVSRSLAERTRGFAARASSPSGGAVTSLASRSAIANSAVERVLSSARPPRFFGGSRAHQADKPHDLRASRVILGWVTKVPLPLVTSTKPRSAKF